MSLPDAVRLDGKRALVTGAARGIGRGCALELAKAGADLVVNDRPGNEELEELAEEIRSLGRDCQALGADVFSREGCESLVAEAVEVTGGFDILVSNPAYSRRGGFLDYSPEEFDRTIDGTFKAGFHIGQLSARHFVERGQGGKIVFISSVQAEMPFERSAPYGAAKAALNHLTQTIAVELFPHRVNVNAIEPGWIDTPNERAVFSDEVLEAAGKELPWGRLGTPGDIGRAAAFLVSEAADYITGTILPVDGGFRLKDMRAKILPEEKDPR